MSDRLRRVGRLFVFSPQDTEDRTFNSDLKKRRGELQSISNCFHMPYYWLI